MNSTPPNTCFNIQPLRQQLATAQLAAAQRSAVVFFLAMLCLSTGTLDANEPCGCSCNGSSNADRLWVINTRSLTTRVACANLESPSLSVYTMDSRGRQSRSSLDEYFESISDSSSVVMYVHGNRLTHSEAIARSLDVYRKTQSCCRQQSIDWVVWSWPAAPEGLLATDARIKAKRTDSQGLYLGWLLRRHAERGIPTALVGYSFGSRVITGALHATAGGQLGGRALSGPGVTGLKFDAGLVAPAIESDWLGSRGYHRLASTNIDQLLLLYNRRDAVLKRYWLLSRVRNEMALGYTGPTSFAPRSDGSRIFVRSKDCAAVVGLHHSELDYYRKSCNAGGEMANLINDLSTTH